MNRNQFFKVMASSLRETLKEVSTPFVEEDWHKLQSFSDDLVGIKWYEVLTESSLLDTDMQEIFVNGKHVVIVTNQHQPVAFEKICPECHNLLQWIAYDKRYKCFHCDKGFSMDSLKGEIEPTFLPTKLVENKIVIGLIK